MFMNLVSQTRDSKTNRIAHCLMEDGVQLKTDTGTILYENHHR